MKFVIVSGYFTALHKGHIKYFEAAKKLGDRLIVIINNDKQQIAKKGRLVQSARDIEYIIRRLEMIDIVVVSVDLDESVCKSLSELRRFIREDIEIIFANGGDRHAKDIPEYKLCKKLGIKMRFNVGGKKINSSTNILGKGG